MLLGTGLAFYLGKPFIEPQAPMLPSIDLGKWAVSPQLHNALHINPLFVIGVVLAFLLQWGLRNTRWGMTLRLVGDHAETARAMGYPLTRDPYCRDGDGRRLRGCRRGVSVAGLSGQLERRVVERTGLDGGRARDLRALAAVALSVGRAAVRCSGRAGPALQAIGVTSGYYLYNAAPYVLTLVDHDHQLPSRPHACRRTGRTEPARAEAAAWAQ